MSRTYNVIDADGHVLEPLDLWENYIDPAFRDRAPRCHIDERGNEHMIFEGRMFPGGNKGLGLSGGVGTAKEPSAAAHRDEILRRPQGRLRPARADCRSRP